MIKLVRALTVSDHCEDYLHMEAEVDEIVVSINAGEELVKVNREDVPDMIRFLQEFIGNR